FCVFLALVGQTNPQAPALGSEVQMEILPASFQPHPPVIVRHLLKMNDSARGNKFVKCGPSIRQPKRPCAPSRRLLDSYRRCTNPKRPKCPLDSFYLFLRFSRWPWPVATKCRSISSASSKALRCHPIPQRLWDRRLGLRCRTGSGHRGRPAWERSLPSSTPPRQRKTSLPC